MQPLRCPACKKQALQALTDSETELEVDTCPECLGVWFDSGELTTFYKSPQLLQRLMPAGGGSVHHTYEISTRTRRCPRCRQGMEQPLVGGITLDVCRDCRGIWFDNGELRKVTQIYKERGLQGDDMVADQVRAGHKGDGKGKDAFAALSWFFNSFLSKKVR